MSQLQSAEDGSVSARRTNSLMGANITGKEGQNWAYNTLNQLPQLGLDKTGSGVNCHIKGWSEFKTDGPRFVGQNVHI